MNVRKTPMNRAWAQSQVVYGGHADVVKIKILAVTCAFILWSAKQFCVLEPLYFVYVTPNDMPLCICNTAVCTGSNDVPALHEKAKVKERIGTTPTRSGRSPQAPLEGIISYHIHVGLGLGLLYHTICICTIQ